MFILLEVLQIGIAVLSFTLIRTRELARVVAIQRSLGATQVQIARAIFIESIWPFLPAALLGCIFGFGVFFADQGLSQVYPRDYIVTLIPIVVSMLLCILAAWQPAQRFAKIPPANLM
jgi:ABC-type antimicrobial peptide transport system permease subunit